jgi:hypothetical protein
MIVYAERMFFSLCEKNGIIVPNIIFGRERFYVPRTRKTINPIISPRTIIDEKPVIARIPRNDKI